MRGASRISVAAHVVRRVIDRCRSIRFLSPAGQRSALLSLPQQGKRSEKRDSVCSTKLATEVLRPPALFGEFLSKSPFVIDLSCSFKDVNRKPIVVVWG